MNAFKAGLLAGAVLGSVTAATVFAQFGTPVNSAMRPPEAMSNAERREALARCDGSPAGPSRDQCMADLLANRNAAATAGRVGSGLTSRAGDGRTGAPGIGTGPSAVTGDAPNDAGQGARANRP